MTKRIIGLVTLVCAAGLSCVSVGRQVLLFEGGLQHLQPGPLSTDLGAYTEYHYLPQAAPKGPWEVSNDLGWWSVREEGGRRWIHQSGMNDWSYSHPMLVAGDSLWMDLRIRARLRPESADGQSGVVFRYQDDRCYYFFGVQAGKVVLKAVNHETGFHQAREDVLGQAALRWQPGDCLQADVTVKGSRIVAVMNGSVRLEAVDALWPSGRIGLTADSPAAFSDIQVVTTPAARAAYVARRVSFDETERRLQAANPSPVVWRKISTEGFGVGRSVRFGDLDNDGVIDVLFGQVLHHGPKDRNSELSCLTAMTLEGRQLWQIGTADPWKDRLTNDVAFQIHDLDGDGRNEVVYCRDLELVVADGATGQVRNKVPTPETPGGRPYKGEYNTFPRILGDCLFFCDLRGTGHDSDVILKDRYRYVWAFNDKLELLWRSECNTGHYPYACDVDGDGRDEVMAGYTLFDDDGKVLWSLDSQLQDHADGVAILRFKTDSDLRLLCAASDEGLFFTDMRGRVLLHHYIGHVQNPAVANLRDDLAGLETVTVNFWRNEGIIHYLDADGLVYHSFEPTQYGSMCLPVNWTGRSEEYFVLNANVNEGGLFDGWGRRVVCFPDDGHPDMCNAVLDLTGDCRDEIVVWDPHQLWVYTQSDNPKSGRLYKPGRNPLYNTSNYQATVSSPGWSQP